MKQELSHSAAGLCAAVFFFILGLTSAAALAVHSIDSTASSSKADILSTDGEKGFQEDMEKGKLFEAVLNGELSAVKSILAKKPELIEAENQRKSTPLILAASAGHEKVVSWLLDCGAKKDADNQFGRTALHYATKGNYLSMVRLLINKGANPDGVEGSPLTPLHLAAENGSKEMAALLIDAGSDVNKLDGKGKSALFYAAKHGNEKAAEYLKEAGASGAEEENFGPSLYLRNLHMGSAYMWKLKDRGWAVKTKDHLFIFDNEEHSMRPDRPLLANGFVSAEELKDQNVMAVYTAYHADAYAKEFVHALDDQLDDITYLHFKKDQLQGNRNALFIGGQGMIQIKGAEVSYSEEMDREGMGWQTYLIRSGGVEFFYSGFLGAEGDGHDTTLHHFKSHSKGCDLAFIQLSAMPRRSDYEFFGKVIAALNPKKIFLHQPLGTPNQRVLQEMEKRYPGREFIIAQDPGERFHL